MLADEGHRLISGVDDLLDLDGPVVEAVQPFCEPSVGFIDPDAGLRLHSAAKRGRVPDEVGMDCFRQNLSGPLDVLVGAPEQIDVLLRHPQLRQPGGFEGLVGVEIFPNADRFAAPEIDQAGDAGFGPSATLPAAPTEITDRNDALAEVPEFRRLGLSLCERFVKVSQELAGSLMSPIDRRFSTEQHLQ
jgi:hypothetical protein